METKIESLELEHKRKMKIRDDMHKECVALHEEIQKIKSHYVKKRKKEKEEKEKERRMLSINEKDMKQFISINYMKLIKYIINDRLPYPGAFSIKLLKDAIFYKDEIIEEFSKNLNTNYWGVTLHSVYSYIRQKECSYERIGEELGRSGTTAREYTKKFKEGIGRLGLRRIETTIREIKKKEQHENKNTKS